MNSLLFLMLSGKMKSRREKVVQYAETRMGFQGYLKSGGAKRGARAENIEIARMKMLLFSMKS
ncbi:MAG: hypothetical protein ABWW66_04810 [Archaeoglobaceae archaeon]